MRKVILGVAAVAVGLLSACGTGGGDTAAQVPAVLSTAPPTTTTATSTTVAPTTTTTVAPTTTTTKPKPTTTTKPSTTKPKPTTTKPKPAPSPGTPCTTDADACIDLSANQSWLLEDGKVVYGPVPITSGRPGYLTPPGTFKVQWKDIDHKSSEFNDAPMPYSVFFNSGIAFHQGSLKVKSHGCIHLSNAAAKTFYNGLKVGDVVQVVK
ncbi:L,D-transpeptidase [Actinokineospora sp. PR83]|uniref:L,D-transpeptidase n=1 Tax=Actinokineospora sp. PR83 TaxID=2884908 RepID=UPI001F2AF40C|nr:L,D-transpeptidase [Actinokineospora sp. PR83]MCG8919972.1 L,D-transpeptidase [Actinokineospora sp. PR83]